MCIAKKSKSMCSGKMNSLYGMTGTYRIIFVWISLLLCWLPWIQGLPEHIRIGGLFDDSEEPTIENAFRYAIMRVNRDNLLTNTKLEFDIQHLPSQNSFLASRKACNQAGLGVASVFGPRSSELAQHINSMCNTLEIPHLEARLEPRHDPAHLFSMNLYPETSQLTRAYLDILKLLDWKKFCVIYGDQSDLLVLQDIIHATLPNGVEITVRQAKRGTMRETLKEIDKKGIRNILAHLNVDDTFMLLKSALQVGMIDPEHHYILTNLDIETIHLDDFKHNAANLTGFRLISRSDPGVQETLEQMKVYQSQGQTILNSTDPLTIKTEAALMYDAIYVLAHAIVKVDRSTRLRLVNLSCEGDQAWAFGSSLYNYLNLVTMDGLTGPISFNRGRRYDFNLDILQLKEAGLKKVGEWNPTDGLNFTSRIDMLSSSGIFTNKTLIVTSLLEPPYVMRKNGDMAIMGNDQFEGFCVDILNEIASTVGFKYKIELVPDGKYGAPDKDGNWNGMVQQLIEKKADLAVASLTINYIRENVIDFTKPFMNLGISILFKKPREESPDLFSFLNPLAIEIWIYVIAAYFVVSLIMFVLARFSPYEWYNPHPCDPDHGVVENIFTLSNSFWFAVGTLMQQGSDINPRAVSTRIVGGIWWFFTLIIISSYTANLAAFLTVERMVSPIENAEDLSKQTDITYGTINGGSTYTFFRESSITTYKRMWKYMESADPSVFVKTSQEGIARVEKGNYAFLMESTMIDYTIQTHCELMQVGGLLDSKGYGIGTQKDSLFRDPISMKILELQESGQIQLMYNRWWKTSGTCSHNDKSKESKANSLGVENVGGIFVVLFVGLALAIFVAFVEFMVNSKKNSPTDRSVWAEMMEELRFAARCHGSSKKPALKRQCSTCLHHSNGPCTVESPNGVIQLKDMKKAQMANLNNRGPQYSYYEPEYDYRDGSHHHYSHDHHYNHDHHNHDRNSHDHPSHDRNSHDHPSHEHPHT